MTNWPRRRRGKIAERHATERSDRTPVLDGPFWTGATDGPFSGPFWTGPFWTDAGACGELDGWITCSFDNLTSGARAAIDLTRATAAAFDPDAGRREADVTADQADPDDPDAMTAARSRKATRPREDQAVL